MSNRWAAVLLVLALTLTACGGSDDGPRSASSVAIASPTQAAVVASPTPTRPVATPTPAAPSDAQIVAFAKLYVRTEWSYLASTTTPRDFYDLFTVECQRKVTLESLAKTPGFAQVLNEGMKGAVISDVAFLVPVRLNAAGDIFQLFLPKDSETRLLINGKAETIYDWRKRISAFPVTDQQPSLNAVLVANNLKVSSCEGLTQYNIE